MMAEVLRWGRRGYSRSREQLFADCDMTPQEQADFGLCGATFYVDNGVYGCPLPPGHGGDQWSDQRWGRWRWSDGGRVVRRTVTQTVTRRRPDETGNRL